jgi:alkaline phosphatase
MMVRSVLMPLGLCLAAISAGCATGHRSSAPSEQVAQPAKRARNVIVFIGDGMGISTITAARIFDGQSRGMSGEENLLSFERFPNVALVKTYNSNQQVPDSAGTATAIHTGVKTRAGVVGIAPEARRRNCTEALAHPLPTIGERVKAQGKALGFVTTTRVTHATPASLYAHSAERDWESDRYIPDQDLEAGCVDIARQLLEFPGGVDIALGGGTREFQGSSLGGQRKAVHEDLIQQWLQAGANRRLIQSRSELRSVRPDEQILGLFAKSHMTYVAQRPEDTREPTLSEMTAAAIDRLNADADGYYLLVEGGRIDHGHHDGKPGYALSETQALAAAVSVALEKVDLNETLILVTADHSHTFTISGYPTRGHPILENVVGNDISGTPKTTPTLAADGLPYNTLGYMNGPGAVVGGSRGTPQTGIHATAQALVPFSKPEIDGKLSDAAAHGGEDVAVYATGPGASQVHGVLEQNRIFDIVMAAFGWQAAE